MSSTPFRDTVSTEDSNDELIRERAFKISESIELADIIIPIDEQETEDVNEIEHVDEALGEIFDPFSQEDENSPGYVNRDGTVNNEPERDLTTNLYKEGETVSYTHIRAKETLRYLV